MAHPMRKPRSRTATLRRVLALALVASATTGCATMKSPGEWFARDPLAAQTAQGPGVAARLASAGQGIGGQFKSMGTAMSSAFSKTKNVVTAPFQAKTGDASDPTSLSSMPSNLGPEIWVTNGQLYESQQNFAKALDNYSKALELEPTNEAALLSVARLYARQSKHAEASGFFGKALAVAPSASTYNEHALSLQAQGKSAEAQAAVAQAITAEPSNVRYRNNLASMLVAGGRSDEAVQQLQQVFPPAVANYNVAYLHFANKNVAAAQQHLQQALTLDPNLAQARELMTTISGSPAAETAVAAYQTAGNIYRTAEATMTPQVQAGNAVFQSSPATSSGQAVSPPATGLPIMR